MADAETVVARILNGPVMWDSGPGPVTVEVAGRVVAALRAAGLLLPEDAEIEYCPEGHDADGELAQHHRVVGPWVPVEEDTK